MKFKSKTTIPVLMLAVSSLLLAACGGGNTSKDVSSTTSQGDIVEPVKRIIVNAPDTFVVGDVFNLDDYVDIETMSGNTSDKYEIEIKDISADVILQSQEPGKEHEFTVLKEGTISINIIAGPKEAEKTAKFNAESISAIKGLYREATKDLDKVFGFGELIYDEKTDEPTGEIEDFCLHNNNYVWFNGWSSNEDGSINSGGIMRTGKGFTHFFEMSPDGELTVEPAKMSDLDLYYVAGSYALPYTALETQSIIDDETGEELEYLYIDYTDATGALEDTINYNMGIGWNDQFCTHSIMVYPLYNDDGSVSDLWEFDIFIAYKKAPRVMAGLAASMVLYTNPEDCAVPELDKYIEEGKEPEPLKYDELTTAIDAIGNAKNYTLTITTSTYYYDRATSENVECTDDSLDVSGLGIINGMSQVTKVDENNAFTTLTVGSQSTSYGCMNKEGEVVEYVPSDTNPGKYDGTVIAGITDIWSTAYNGTISTITSANAVAYTAFEVNSNEDVKGVRTIEINGAYATNWVKSLLEMTDAGSALVSWVDGTYDPQAIPDGYPTFYTFVDVVVEIYEGKVVMTIDTQTPISMEGDGIPYAQWVYTFDNIGTTVVDPVDVTLL